MVVDAEIILKELAKLGLDIDDRPYRPGEKETYKKLIDNSKSPSELVATILLASGTRPK